MNISSKLKALRRSKGLSQEGLAAASGISIRTIQRIEKGLSVGNGFTLNALARALDIETQELTVRDLTEQELNSGNMHLLKLMNLSAVCVVLVPLSNLIIPSIIFWKNRNDEGIRIYGRKILSFQILWTLATILLMVIAPAVLLLLFEFLHGGGIPLSIPVYFLAIIVNVCVTVRFALAIDGRLHVFHAIPNIL